MLPPEGERLTTEREPDLPAGCLVSRRRGAAAEGVASAVGVLVSEPGTRRVGRWRDDDHPAGYHEIRILEQLEPPYGVALNLVTCLRQEHAAS